MRGESNGDDLLAVDDFRDVDGKGTHADPLNDLDGDGIGTPGTFSYGDGWGCDDRDSFGAGTLRWSEGRAGDGP